ncbi:MAG: hypothetical protein C4291_13435 [Candidatus Dadabacteria bacterium]
MHKMKVLVTSEKCKFPIKYSEVVLILFLIVTIGLTMSCNSNSEAQSGGTIRQYYIAAEEVIWDYAPTGWDLVHGGPIPEPYNGNTKWKKLRYIEYTDGTFQTHKPQPEWLGILGPIIRAEVGDTIVVHFLNRTPRELSIHPHGVRYDKDNEEAHYNPPGAVASVPPDGSFTYTWLADEQSAPGPSDPNSIVWWIL